MNLSPKTTVGIRNLHNGRPFRPRTSVKWNQCSIVLPRDSIMA